MSILHKVEVDDLCRRIDEALMQFFPWERFTEEEKNHIRVHILQPNIKRVSYVFFGIPMELKKMRSPRRAPN